MDIQQIRNDTQYCDEIIHFNNAGSSLPVKTVNDAIIEYLKEEEKIGAYELKALRNPEINQLYTEIAQLIQSDAREIAITENASTAFRRALFSIPFQSGDHILTSNMEYGANYINYLRLKKEKGIKVKVIPDDSDGIIDLKKLKSSIDKSVKLIAITHMPTSSGSIAPVEEIGKIAKQNEILYLVDACQSIGHYPIDVQKIQCDFLSATSRKYLRGPRGLGFLYVNKNVIDSVEAQSIDILTAEWVSEQEYRFEASSKMFESWEKSYALMIGFTEAVKYANKIGMDHIWKRIQFLSRLLRKELRQTRGIQLYDIGENLSGIISMTKSGITPELLHKKLLKNNVNSSVISTWTSLSDLKKKNIEQANRISVHYYNTEKEVEDFLRILNSF